MRPSLLPTLTLPASAPRASPSPAGRQRASLRIERARVRLTSRDYHHPRGRQRKTPYQLAIRTISAVKFASEFSIEATFSSPSPPLPVNVQCTIRSRRLPQLSNEPVVEKLVWRPADCGLDLWTRWAGLGGAPQPLIDGLALFLVSFALARYTIHGSRSGVLDLEMIGGLKIESCGQAYPQTREAGHGQGIAGRQPGQELTPAGVPRFWLHQV